LTADSERNEKGREKWNGKKLKATSVAYIKKLYERRV
jgi:hypothetical protein